MKVEVQFGTNTPSPDGGVDDCVFRSICWIRGEGSLSIHPGESGINTIAELYNNESLIIAFDKSDLPAEYIAFHFENDEFLVINPVTFPNIGITNSDLDYPISPNTYPVIYEDEEIIAIEIN